MKATTSLAASLRSQAAALQAQAATLLALADACERGGDAAPVDEWIAVAACALPQRTVRAAGKRGALEIRRIGRADFVRRSELDRWAASKTSEPSTDSLIAAGRLRVVGGRRAVSK